MLISLVLYDTYFTILLTISPSGPSDCADILYANRDVVTSGAYCIYPNAGAETIPVQVWCDMDTDGGGWTVSYYNYLTSGHL